MVKVTEKGKDELKKLILLHALHTQDCIKLAYRSLGQLGFIFGKPKDGDEIVLHEGRMILIIGREFRSILDGAILNVEYTDGKREFVMTKK